VASIFPSFIARLNPNCLYGLESESSAARLITESRDAHPVAAHPLFCANAECAALASLDDEELAEKYRHLAERLSRAFTAAPVVGDERHRYVNALLAIANFFDGLGLFDTYAEKFATLAAALNDLDNGIVRGILKPAHIANRIPDPIEVWVGRAYVAIAIDALIKAGNNPDEAKLFIQAIEYSPLSALATTKANSLSTAAWEWRSRFHQNRIKNDVAKKVFEAGRRHLKTLSSSSDFTNAARISLSLAKQIVLGPAFQRQSKLSSD
jgi:hypothetical protein